MTKKQQWANRYFHNYLEERGYTVMYQKVIADAWLAGFETAKTEALDFLHNGPHGFIEATPFETWGEDEVHTNPKNT